MQVTQCPECHTAFKVSPEHLAVANGWVRCGRCGGVFEALQHLELDTTTAAEPVPQVATRTPDAADAADAADADGGLLASAATHDAATPAAASKAIASDIEAFHDSLMSFVPGAIKTPAVSEDVPAFVQTSSNTTSPERTMVWLWGVLSGVLGLALLLQATLWHRHVLVAQEPALQGLIEGLCAPIGCEWHWPQTLDAVQIENSNFTENADGTYRLQLRLKNTQHHAVAMPLLELTLTDERDDVVLRRVFQPQELGLKDHMPALRDARSTLNFDLNEDLKPRVVGFRALIFYP